MLHHRPERRSMGGGARGRLLETNFGGGTKSLCSVAFTPHLKQAFQLNKLTARILLFINRRFTMPPYKTSNFFCKTRCIP